MSVFVSTHQWRRWSVHFSRSDVSDSLRPHESQHTRPPLSITNSWSSLKLMSIELVMPSNHLTLCIHLLLPPSIFSILCIRWPKYWSFSFNISPMNIGLYSNEYSGLISFRVDWLDLLEVQGTLKSLLQHRSSKAFILWCSAFFIVQLSHPYMTTGKTTALTRWTFAHKVMSLLFNMLSMLVTGFLPRSKHLLISWLQSPSAVILEPKETKFVTVFTVSPSRGRWWGVHYTCGSFTSESAHRLLFFPLSLGFFWKDLPSPGGTQTLH